MGAMLMVFYVPFWRARNALHDTRIGFGRSAKEILPRKALKRKGRKRANLGDRVSRPDASRMLNKGTDSPFRRMA
jgi:hypothetical protein